MSKYLLKSESSHSKNLYLKTYLSSKKMHLKRHLKTWNLNQSVLTSSLHLLQDVF